METALAILTYGAAAIVWMTVLVIVLVFGFITLIIIATICESKK